MQYGFVIDQDTCIGCHACTVACKTEHEVPLGVNRTWVKYIEKGAWPDTSRFFSVMRCNHCANAPCVTICPTSALYRRTDGIVDFDTSRCIGCKSCMQACPYDALYIDPDDHTAQKCNYCAHRVAVGLEPACVIVCPEQAIVAGDLDDPASRIARMVATEELTQRAVEQGTGPNVWYKGADEASLDPLGAVPSADGGIWRDAPGIERSWLAVELAAGDAPRPEPTRHGVVSSGGMARVVYANEFPMPWGWRVSSYFLTKGISAGIALTAAVALVFGAGVESLWLSWVAPLVAGLFLVVTGVLLVADLKRPDRFLFLLTKENPGSWLVRGAWILGLFAVVLAAWFVTGLGGPNAATEPLIWAAAIVALGVAGYTAFLFGQAEARDLWQSPSLLGHMLAAAFLVGGGASVSATLWSDVGADSAPGSMVLAADGDSLLPGVEAFAWAMLIGAAIVGSIALFELGARHPTRNIQEAMHHMTRGAFAVEWWVGALLAVVVSSLAAGAVLFAGAPVAAGAGGGLAAAIGVWLMDDAFVRAGQSVPLS